MMTRKRKYSQAGNYGAGVFLGGNSFSYNPNYSTVKNTYTKAGGGAGGGVKFSKEKHHVGRRRRSNRTTKSDLLKNMCRVRARWQLTSPNLTGPGRIPIATGGNSATDGEHQFIPVHFMSLSQSPYHNVDGVDQNKGTYPYGLYRVYRKVFDAGGGGGVVGDLGYSYLNCQTRLGVNNYAAGIWQAEQHPKDRDFDKAQLWGRMFHKWTDIRLNLYGAKHIPLEYNIMICQLPKEFSPFQHAPNPITPVPTVTQPQFGQFGRWMEDICRPLIGNPINVPGTKAEWRNHVKILKSYKVNIAPLSYTNAAAEGEAPVKVGNVRHLKIFLRHDRWRTYNWAETDKNTLQDLEYNVLGWDVSQTDAPVVDVSWDQRLYMFITCNNAGAVDGAMNDVRTHQPSQMSDIPSDYGSYDINVRNEFYIYS